MSVGRGNNKKRKFFVSIVCLLFLIFASSLTISFALLRSDKSDTQQNSFGAVVLHDNSQYKYKSKIQNKLVGEEYLFNDIKLTVADNTSPVFIRAHVYFDSTNEVAKDKIKFNSFSVEDHESYTWSRFGDYWYLCDNSGKLMSLNSTKAGEVYVFLNQVDAIVPEMQGALGDDEFVSCEIIVQSSLASNFSNTTDFSEINKSFDKNATEATKSGTFTIEFKQNGTTLSTQTINYGGRATIPEVTTAEGEVFLCWNTREDGSGANITNEQLNYITQNLTLYPTFENQKVLVTVVQSEGGIITPETQMVDWGSDLVMHFTANKNYVLKRILINGDPVGAANEYLLKRITGAVKVSAEFVSDYIVLDINGGAGEQPNVVYNGDQTKFMLEGNEPTKSGKEFYYYSTDSADNEQGQNGDRYDLGYWYDVPNTSGTTTLYAIYLTPSSNYQTAQNYVVVPKNVSAIADSAVNIFDGTNNTVKFVTLPRQTSKIGKNAFANCSGLVGVSMSDFVTSIGENAFKSDSALTTFRAPTSLQILGKAAFSGCGTLAKVTNLDATSISEIPNDCFGGCSQLEEVILPVNLVRIGESAFVGTALKTINLEDTKLEELGASAFNSCSALTQVTVPSTLKTVGQAVFMFSGITEVKNFAGTSVSRLEKWTFWYSSLIQIELPETLEIIDEQVFASCSELTRVGGLQSAKVTSIAGGAFSGCTKLTNVIFPQTLLTLGDGAFSGCSALTSVTFKSKLATIGANAFEGCSSLSQLTGLESTVVTSIGDGAFKDCSSLVDVSLPNTVQTIGANAFANCSGLATINFINDSNLSTLSVASNSFAGTTSDLKVNILDESHFDEYISKLNGKGFAENAFMFFLGNIDRKAYYKNAVWEKFHDAVITSTAGEHGTISPSGSVIYSLGSSASYVISPDTGYKIKSILVDGVEIAVTAADGAAQSYEFVDIQKDHTISAEFEQRVFKITVICGENGKIDPSESADYAYGSNVTFVITPSDGHVIKDVLIDGVSNAKAKENAEYTFSNIRSNHEIEVSFEVVTFTIVSSVGEGGKMSPNQITTIKNWGESHEVTYTPNEKHVISTIIVDGEAINLSGVDVSKPYTYTFSKITANHVISCQFESTQRTLTYDPNGGDFADGDSSKTQEYNAFSKQTITLISLNPVRTGYTFKGWNTMSDGSGQGNLTGKIYSDIFGKEDGWLYAIWEIKQFKITTSTANAHGTITESMTVDWGSTATVEMKPNEGYRVSTYKVDGGNAITSTVQAGNSDYYTFRNVTADHAISVTFAPITYTIRYNGNGATSGATASSTHTYDAAKKLTANGFSRTGYTFAGWATSANGNIVYKNEESVTNLSAKQGDIVDLYAVWTANIYVMTLDENNRSNLKTKNVVYDQPYGTFDVPSKTGYTYVGWRVGKRLIDEKTFNGSSDYVNLGRTYMYTDRITVMARAYMDDWTQYKNGMRIISCTEGGGWNLEQGGDYLQFAIYDSGVGYKVAKSNISFANLASGWHTFVANFDGEYARLYIDGIGVGKSEKFSSGKIGYHASNSILVGAEAGSSSSPVGSYFKGKISYVSIFNSSNYYTKDTISSAKCPAYNTVAVAHWTPNTYSITFQADGASIYEKYWNYAGSTGYTSSNAGSYSKYTLADSRKSPTYANAVYDSTLSVYTPIPQRLGYTFVGWYSSTSGGVKVADANGSLVASATGFTGAIKQWQNANNITLYAQWSVNKYAVEYAMNGGTKGSTSPSTYTFGTTTTISDPTRNGYTFTGWSVVATLDGKRSGTINMNSGILEYSSSYANAVYFPLFYQKAGVSYTAKLSNDQIRWRQWHTTGGYFGNASDSATFTSSEARLLSLWYYTGMSDDTTTLSWTGGKSFKIDANQVGKLTLTANWTPNKITITLNKNGGSGGTDKFYYTYGINKFYSDANLTQELTSITFPTRAGYTFSHYYGDGTSGGNKDEQYSMTTSGVTSTDLCTDIYKDATLYAKWTGIQYTITLDKNGGSGGSLGKTTYTTSPSAQTISITNPTAKTGYHLDHYTFAGYSGSIPSVSGTTLTIPANTYGNLTLTAIWSPNTYTVHYSPYGSTNENLLSFDPSFESIATGTMSGWTNQAGNATIKVVSGTAYGGNKSLEIAGADGGNYRVYKTYSGVEGTKYVFSVYMKTSGSGSIRIELNGGNYSWTGYSKSYTGNNSWQHLEIETEYLTSNTTVHAFLYTGSATSYYDDVYLSRSEDLNLTLYEATAKYDAAMPNVYLPTRAGYVFGGYFSQTPSFTNKSYSQNNLLSDTSPTWRIGIGTTSGYSTSTLQVGYILKFYFTYSTTATLKSIDINDVDYTDYCIINVSGTTKVVYGIVTLTSLNYVNQYSFIDLNFSANASVSVTVNTLSVCTTSGIQYYTTTGKSQKNYQILKNLNLYANWFTSNQTFTVSCTTDLSGWNAWTVGSSAHTNCFIYDGDTIFCNGVSGFENLYIPVTIPSGWTTTFSWHCNMPTISANYANIGAGKMRVQLLNYVPTDGSNVGNEKAYVEMASDASSDFSMTYSTAGTYYLVFNFGFCNDGSLLKYTITDLKMVSTKAVTSTTTLPGISSRKNNTTKYWSDGNVNYPASSTFKLPEQDNINLNAEYVMNKVQIGFYVESKSYWSSASIYINGTQKYSDSQLKVGSKISAGTFDAGTKIKLIATVTKLAEDKKQYGVEFWGKNSVNDSTTASKTVTIEVELDGDDLQWVIRDHTASCVAEGTLITLADGTKKKVEDLTISDKLLIFNHETGKHDVASINFIENDGRKVYDIINLKFSNGVTSRVIYEHGYFDLDLNKYVYIRENTYKQYIGHRFYSEDGVVTLVDAYMTTERTGCYSLVTSYHLNYFTDGVLSMPGGISGLFNIFEYDEDLKFNQDDMKLAIEEFGLFEYEDFADYVSKEEFDSYPTKYLKISMGRGLMTWEDIEYLIARYCNK